ncbi:MAG TPA: aldehyde dehydrogenase family protein, partial [Actinomycetes bacterium]
MSSVATGTDKPSYRHFIAGEWVDAADGATFDDLNPYTGEVVATVAAGGRQDARRAVEAAAAAFPAWSQAPPAQRQRIFLAAADLLERRGDEVVGLLARETGSTFGFGMFQLQFVPGLLRQAAGLAYRPIGEVIPSDLPGAFAMGIRRPVGVVGAIAPWNAALILSARSIAAALVLGNTVVAKPSEESPFVGGLLWGEIFTEAGLPDGALNVVTHGPGQAGPIGDELVENPLVRR